MKKMADDNTPVKSRAFIPESSSRLFCAVCFENLPNKYKTPKDNSLLLWKQDERTDACKIIEKYLETQFSKDTDFHVVCKPCHRAAKNAIRTLQKKKDALATGQKEIVPHHLCTEIKRGLPSDVKQPTTEGNVHYKSRRTFPLLLFASAPFSAAAVFK